MQKLRFAVFGNTYQAKKSNSVQKLLAILEELKAEILIDSDFYTYLAEDLKIDIHPNGIISDDDFSADFAISMGGDGTFLETARRVGSKHIPMLGFNMGRMGFLSDYQAEEIPTIIEALYHGEYTTQRRAVLQVSHSNAEYPFALNEVAILKHDISSMISIRVDVDGQYLTTYQADGLIINTPTGSTGYALSEGGPIMAPGSHTIGLVPVAPHSLTVRPLTLPLESRIDLTVESRSHSFLLSTDGRSLSCSEDTHITIEQAPYHILVVKHGKSTFFNTLRKKLMWGADSRE